MRDRQLITYVQLVSCNEISSTASQILLGHTQLVALVLHRGHMNNFFTNTKYKQHVHTMRYICVRITGTCGREQECDTE